ncbi:alpha/beta hydrolase [Pseudolabrys sp. FHR47]|uniref:alpha/beta hydrolase n=1 Tax=Pseudolabrys sp. FHR47 TaxID=2562284 RepID=UPI0010BEAE94|nr:alpha/beta hydrolase [Pseudolabrys sp. FHR47]
MPENTGLSFTARDYDYHRGASGPQLVRVYRPDGPGPFPSVVDVHGGGWGTGNRLNNTVIHEYLARSGIVVAAIDFRLSGEARYPASIADTNLAIRWLKFRAADFNSRPDLVGGVGSSSGGHQLLLNALKPNDSAYAVLDTARFPDIDASLSFVVALWPVADPWARYQMAQRQAKEALIRSHAAYWNSDEEMQRGNPHLLLERREQTHLPPLLIMQGTADDNLTPDMAERFSVAYRSSGGHAELSIVGGASHAFITRDPGAPISLAALAKIARFIKAIAGVA